MPKRLPARFTSKTHCKKCGRMRSVCYLCAKCTDDCKCKEIPDPIRWRIMQAVNDLQVSIHRLATNYSGTGEDPIAEDDVYDALTEVDFQGIFEKYFQQPPEKP